MARNTALKQAQGKYVAFMDPDDWFEPDAFEELSSYAEKMKNTSKFDEINKGIKPKEKELVSK